MIPQYYAESIYLKCHRLRLGDILADVDRVDQLRVEWTAFANTHRAAPKKWFSLPNLSRMSETQGMVVTGSAMRNKYAIHEFTMCPSYGGKLPFDIWRTFASKGGEVMICVFFHSANPKIRDIVDVEDYVFPRTTG